MWIIISPLVIKYLTPKNTGAFTFFPFIFLASQSIKEDKVFINHEMIHLRQQAEQLLLLFLLWYYTELVIRLIQYKDFDAAYRNISFEREAYAHESDFNYLKIRKFWSFLKYV